MFTIHSINYNADEKCGFAIKFCIALLPAACRQTDRLNANIFHFFNIFTIQWKTSDKNEWIIVPIGKIAVTIRNKMFGTKSFVEKVAFDAISELQFDFFFPRNSKWIYCSGAPCPNAIPFCSIFQCLCFVVSFSFIK